MTERDATPPVQDMVQVMTMVAQLIAAQQQQQDALVKLMADKNASSSSSITGLSAPSPSVDTRGVFKCEDYYGEKDKFMKCEKVFYSSL